MAERFVLLTRDPIPTALAGRTGAPVDVAAHAGAWLEFQGAVRDREPDGSRIAAITYEAHEAMAEHQIHRLLDRLERAHPVLASVFVHRLGRVPVGEPSLLIRLFTPHRGEALQACAELIDGLKQDVPIWKHPERA